MPHYADGTEAKVGDLVEGRGYNVPHPIAGIIIGITPGESCCNVRIAHMRPVPKYGGARVVLQLRGGMSGDQPLEAEVDVERGQADAFRLVHREGA